MCGRRFTVAARAERICDTITGAWGARSMADTVVLEGAICDGSGHGGCAASCLLYWKDAWLRRVDARADASVVAPRPMTAARESLLALVVAQRDERARHGAPIRFRCQATQAIEASVAGVGEGSAARMSVAYTYGQRRRRSLRAGHGACGRDGDRPRSSGWLSEPPRCEAAAAKSTRTPTLDLQPGRVGAGQEPRRDRSDSERQGQEPRPLVRPRDAAVLWPGVPGEASSRPAHRRAHRRDDRAVAATASRSRARRAPASTAWGAGSVPERSTRTGGKAGSNASSPRRSVGLPTVRSQHASRRPSDAAQTAHGRPDRDRRASCCCRAVRGRARCSRSPPWQDAASVDARPRRRRRCVPDGSLPGVAGRVAAAGSRSGVVRLAGRCRVVDGRGAVRVPVPVPVGRREHGPRMGDVEPQRRLRDRLRRGVTGGRDRAGVLLLPVVPVEPRRVDGGVRQGCTPT